MILLSCTLLSLSLTLFPFVNVELRRCGCSMKTSKIRRHICIWQWHVMFSQRSILSYMQIIIIVIIPKFICLLSSKFNFAAYFQRLFFRIIFGFTVGCAQEYVNWFLLLSLSLSLSILTLSFVSCHSYARKTQFLSTFVDI